MNPLGVRSGEPAGLASAVNPGLGHRPVRRTPLARNRSLADEPAVHETRGRTRPGDLRDGTPRQALQRLQLCRSVTTRPATRKRSRSTTAVLHRNAKSYAAAVAAPLSGLCSILTSPTARSVPPLARFPAGCKQKSSSVNVVDHTAAPGAN